MYKGFWLILAATSLAACGGGGGSSSGGSAPPAEPYTGTLTGTLVAPNGSTPISDATVYLEQQGARVVVSARAAGEGSCPAPANASEWDCTGADGQFSFEVTDLPPGTVLHAQKGAWSLAQPLPLTGNNPGELGPIAFNSDTAAGAANIAVVTGTFDRIQDLLAKMGMGEVGSSGAFSARSAALSHHHRHAHSVVQRSSSLLNQPADFNQCLGLQDPEEICLCMQDLIGDDFPCDASGGGLELGSETFDLYDGDGSLSLADYPDVDALFALHNGQPRLFSYDIVYVNCGAAVPSVANWQSTLQQFVNEGGVLYATDWASQWVEAFAGEAAPALTSGEDLSTLHATVMDAPLAAWLANVTCTDGACINGSTIGLTGFLSGWHLLKPLNGANVTPLVQADVSAAGFPGETNAALTFQFSHGNGQVIYSSYHTEPLHGFEAGYLPQERVLEYLFFSQVP